MIMNDYIYDCIARIFCVVYSVFVNREKEAKCWSSDSPCKQ